MNGQASGHSGNRFVFAAGVVQYSQKRYMGFGVFCYPYPCALNEIGSESGAPGFADGSIPKGLAGLDNRGGQADILGHFGCVLESLGVEDLGCVLPGDDRSDAGVCLEQSDLSCVPVIIESLL